jgi:hypothetical protein
MENNKIEIVVNGVASNISIEQFLEYAQNPKYKITEIAPNKYLLLEKMYG